MGKRGPKPSPDRRRGSLSLRCQAKWSQWVKQFADHRRVTPTTLVDIALMEMAERVGYVAPPKR